MPVREIPYLVIPEAAQRLSGISKIPDAYLQWDSGTGKVGDSPAVADLRLSTR